MTKDHQIRSPRRVLIVDDDSEIRAVLSRACVKAGFQADEAASGLEALRKARAFSYSAITMDVAMQHLDGVDTVAILRNESEAPVIAVSAHLTPQIRSDLSRGGVSYFLDKPFTLAEVAAILEKAATAGPTLL